VRIGQKQSRGEGLDTGFQEYYATISDDELLHIAGDRRDLREEAVLALDGEMARRGLTHEQARAKKRDELRLEIQEARADQRKRKKSKYFVTQISLRWFFIGIVGAGLLMFLTIRPHRPAYEWSEPILVVYTGFLLACLAVQPWVRRTLSFWLSLTIACVPQFIVSHWLTVYHPAQSRSGGKGTWFLSILSGYVVGGAVFLLLQKLKPSQSTQATN
jgi:hypothetical protein